MVYGLPPPTRLLNSGDGCCWGLPVLAHEVSKHAWGLRLRRVRVGLALSSFTLLPSAPEDSVGTPDGEGFRSSISCLLVPLSTLHRLSRDDQCMTRGQDGLLFLSCRTLSFLASCRFIPAFVAVGTRITPRPPHSSVRAHFSAYGSYLECLTAKPFC